MKWTRKISKSLIAICFLAAFLSPYVVCAHCSLDSVLFPSENSACTHCNDHHDNDHCCSGITNAYFTSIHTIVTNEHIGFSINNSLNHSFLFYHQAITYLFSQQETYCFAHFGKDPPWRAKPGFLTRLFIQSFQV